MLHAEGQCAGSLAELLRHSERSGERSGSRMAAGDEIPRPAGCRFIIFRAIRFALVWKTRYRMKPPSFTPDRDSCPVPRYKRVPSVNLHSALRYVSDPIPRSMLGFTEQPFSNLFGDRFCTLMASTTRTMCEVWLLTVPQNETRPTRRNTASPAERFTKTIAGNPFSSSLTQDLWIGGKNQPKCSRLHATPA